MKENLEGKVRKSLLLPLVLVATLGYVIYSRGFSQMVPKSVWDMMFRREGLFVYSQGKEYSLREVAFPGNKGFDLAGYSPQLMATAPTIPCGADVKLRVYSTTSAHFEISRFTDDGQSGSTTNSIVSGDGEIGMEALPSGEYLVKKLGRLGDPPVYSAFRLR